MSRQDPKALYDGFSVIQRGVNSGLAPVSLPRDQLFWAINATFRNGYATCRPGMTRRATNIAPGIFQGAVAFERKEQLVTMQGGHLYAIAIDTWAVTDVSTADLNANNRYRAWFAEAEDFIIAQDGQSPPWIYDGAATRRSDTFGFGGQREVPVGTAMCYGQQRLVVASPDGSEYVVGNVAGDQSTGTVTYNYRDSLLRFTDNDIVANGGAFSVPINAGSINAIRPIGQVDTSTGQGPTQVITTSAIFSLNAPADRTTWSTLTNPIQTVSLVGAGALSDRATVNVNGDIWTRSYDGMRSFIVARREFSYMWANAPMSQELTRAIATDDHYLLSYGSAAVFDNRLLVTIQPYRSWGYGICHRALAVIDFANLAYLSNHTIGPETRGNSAAWEGIWTGLQILQILTGNFAGRERCFIFALNASNQVDLWELSKSDSFDNTGTAQVPIVWQVETGAFTFPRYQGTESVPAQELISLDGGRLFVDEIEGSVSFSASYKLDQDPCWHSWWDWSVCATQQTCVATPFPCTTPLVYKQQYRKPFFLPTPRESKDPVTNKNLNWGREAQAKLVVVGHCRIKRLECLAHDQQDTVVSTPAATETCQPLTCTDCSTDYSYSIV